jgi:hypothetical protein
MFITSFELMDYYLVFHTASLCRRYFSGPAIYMCMCRFCLKSAHIQKLNRILTFFPKLSSTFLFRTEGYNQNSEAIPLIWKAKSWRYHTMKNIGREGTTLCIPSLISLWLLQNSAVTGTYPVFKNWNGCGNKKKSYPYNKNKLDALFNFNLFQ